MAFYCATMLSMALELARDDPAYEDIASKFFEHFVAIADAMNSLGGTGLWDEEDGFYYDQLLADGQAQPLRLRSLVGMIPLLAVEVLEDETIQRLPGFAKRMEWFLENRPDLARHISYMQTTRDGSAHGHRLLAIPSRERLERVLRYVLDENEFLSPYGIRSLSRVYKDQPYVVRLCGKEQRVDYEPGESDTGLFGGNSNWRGPVWVPVNYLLIEALERYHHFYGDGLRVECPTGSGRMLNLKQVAREIARRLTGLFLPDATGRRPCHGGDPRFANDPLGATWCCSTNTSTATPAAAWAPAIRRAGPRWSPGCWKTPPATNLDRGMGTGSVALTDEPCRKGLRRRCLSPFPRRRGAASGGKRGTGTGAFRSRMACKSIPKG